MPAALAASMIAGSRSAAHLLSQATTQPRVGPCNGDRWAEMARQGLQQHLPSLGVLPADAANVTLIAAACQQFRQSVLFQERGVPVCQ